MCRRSHITPSGRKELGIEDVSVVGLGELSLTEYADIIQTHVIERDPSSSLVGRTRLQLPSGAPVERFEFEGIGGLSAGYRYVAMSENQVAFNGTYFFPKDQFESRKDLIEYSISTMQFD